MQAGLCRAVAVRLPRRSLWRRRAPGEANLDFTTDANQRRLWGNTLERQVISAMPEDQTRSAYSNAGHMGTVAVVVVRVGIAVVKVVAGLKVDAVGIHGVVCVDSRIADAHTHTGAVGGQAGGVDLALQTANQWRAYFELPA